MNMEESNNGSLSAEFKHLVWGRSLDPGLQGPLAEGEGGSGEPHMTQVLCFSYRPWESKDVVMGAEPTVM